VVVDGRLLLDAGAPLLQQMHRLGLDPGAIDTCFITHYHGDHVLGLAPYVLDRALVHRSPLTFVGPGDVEARLESLFQLAWGPDWDDPIRGRAELRYVSAAGGGEVNGVSYTALPLPHGSRGGTGYRFQLDGRVLAYSGDVEAGPELERLVEGADVAIVEATGPGDQYSHMSWEQARELAGRHPQTRFIWNHVYAGDLEGAAHDLDVIEV
jgi:ribonuclease BN (tRNA processing enzyme)